MLSSPLVALDLANEYAVNDFLGDLILDTSRSLAVQLHAIVYMSTKILAVIKSDTNCLLSNFSPQKLQDALERIILNISSIGAERSELF